MVLSVVFQGLTDNAGAANAVLRDARQVIDNANIILTPVLVSYSATQWQYT